MQTPSRWLAFFLTASLAAACSSNDSNTDESSPEGAGGAGGSLEGDAGDGADASEDAEVPEAGPDADGGEGGSGGAGGGDSTVTCGEGAPICGETEDGFDVDEPGYLASFDLGVTLMMGQRFGFAAAFFQQAAREDWCKEAASSIPLDTCVIADPADAPAPQCSDHADCAPEQQCVPRTNNGSAIPCSEHCSTARSPMDIGPLEVSGFVDGPITFEADPSQSNGYVTPGDGTIPASQFAFEATYVFQGDGDPDQGIGAFTGQVTLGPELTITSPPLEEGTGFPPGPIIPVDPEQDLELAWSGSVDGGEITLELSTASFGGPSTNIKCRLRDSGSFTIPAELMKALNLGDMPFLNNLNIERIVKGTVTGEGITRGEVTSRQTLLVNMSKKE